MHKKLIRITTVPLALKYLLPGQMKFMKQNGFDVIMISADGDEVAEIVKSEDCPHIIVSMTRKITLLQDVKCLLQLIKIFKKEKPDIVHSHTPKAGLLGMLAAKIAGVKIRIHTVAGIPFITRKGFKFHLLKFIERVTYAAANYVWPNSNSLNEFILKEKLTGKKKLQIILQGSSNGIDLKRFNQASLNEKYLNDAKLSVGYEKQNFYLLFLGRLVSEKGIVELVNVFKNLQKKYPLIKLLLVGKYEPDLDPLPADTLREINDNLSIIHIGWTEKGEYYFHLANCFIFPSHREGFPNVLLQSGAMELPIVCTKIAGNIDLIENSNTGLLFDAGNQTQMTSAIEFNLNHPAEIKIMADNLFKKINKNYKREDVWENILNEYQHLLNQV